MKPVRLLKKLAATAAAGLLALGIVAGTASSAAAGPTSGEISGQASDASVETHQTATSGELS